MELGRVVTGRDEPPADDLAGLRAFTAAGPKYGIEAVCDAAQHSRAIGVQSDAGEADERAS